ncbi:MAG TPA: hypothetical protein VFP05_18615 [Thermomicrobiales bacterium]|nr:hypothetical protein [Thermomicrobiales bacterium]
MGPITIAIAITLMFVATNLFAQLAAAEAVRRLDAPRLPRVTPALALEHPFYSRIDGMPRTRTDRHDLQLAMGSDFSGLDAEQSVWPRDPRI